MTSALSRPWYWWLAVLAVVGSSRVAAEELLLRRYVPIEAYVDFNPGVKAHRGTMAHAAAQPQVPAAQEVWQASPRDACPPTRRRSRLPVLR